MAQTGNFQQLSVSGTCGVSTGGGHVSLAYEKDSPGDSVVASTWTKQGKVMTAVDIRRDSAVSSEISTSKTSYLDSFKAIVTSSSPGRHIFDACHSDNNQPRLWRPTLIRFGPLSGIFCMFLAIASIIASLGILAGSDNQPVSEWSALPSTYLAIFTAIGNLSIRYAAFQGVIIAWWCQVLKGSTLAKLHWNWHAGTTLRGALAAGRQMGLVGLACIFSLLVTVDGPFLQRASTVRTAKITDHPISLNIKMVPELPRGYGGTWETTSLQTLRVENVPAFNRTIPTVHGNIPNNIFTISSYALMHDLAGPWYNNDPLSGVVRGCPGSCTAKLKAPALFPTCIDHILPFSASGALNESFIQTGIFEASLNQMTFMNWAILSVEKYEIVNLLTAYADLTGCKGDVHWSACSLQSGIGEYDIQIEGDKIIMDSIKPPTLITLANNTAVNRTYDPSVLGNPSTLGAIPAFFNKRFEANVFEFRANESVVPFALGADVSQYQGPTSTEGTDGCIAFSDPRANSLESINKLMLYIGALASKEPESYLAPRLDEGRIAEINTTIIGALQGHHSVFHTNYWFFLIASVVEIVCIALVAPTYWGWWRIGRPISFSPLEMAKAFESPLLAEFNSNSSGRDIANKTSSESRLKYGVASGGADGRTRITFGDPASVIRPQKGMEFEV